MTNINFKKYVPNAKNFIIQIDLLKNGNIQWFYEDQVVDPEHTEIWRFKAENLEEKDIKSIIKSIKRFVLIMQDNAIGNYGFNDYDENEQYSYYDAYYSFYTEGFLAYRKIIDIIAESKANYLFNNCVLYKNKSVDYEYEKLMNEVKFEKLVVKLMHIDIYNRRQNLKSMKETKARHPVPNDYYEFSRFVSYLKDMCVKNFEEDNKQLNNHVKVKISQKQIEIDKTTCLLNCDTLDCNYIYDMFQKISENYQDKRCKVIANLTLKYPKLPNNNEIINDINIIANNYGVPNQQILYKIKNKNVHICFCKLTLPDQQIPKALVQKNGKNDYLACCASAMYQISKKYGYSTAGMSYNEKGVLIGDPIKTRYS